MESLKRKDGDGTKAGEEEAEDDESVESLEFLVDVEVDGAVAAATVPVGPTLMSSSVTSQPRHALP
jgi:hypothetical protein